MSSAARVEMSAEADARALAVAGEFAAAIELGVVAAFDVLAAHVGRQVQVRHDPDVPELDGWRSARDAAEYLHEEARAIPEAFGADLMIDAGRITVDANGFVVDPLAWRGTLRLPQPREVVVPYRVSVRMADGVIVGIMGTRHESAVKIDVRAWLTALEAAGGFHPPAAHSRPWVA